MSPLWPLLVLIGISEALTWHLTEKVLHWVHVILAGAIAYSAASHEAAEHAANRCTRLIENGPCLPHQAYEAVPTTVPGPDAVDILKELPPLLIGLLIGGAIRLALDNRRKVRAKAK
jgi:hypothetical protein